MKRLTFVLLALIGLSACSYVQPTTGARIDAARRGKALILIDLQEDYTGPHALQPYQEPERLISAANQLIEAAHAGGWSVYLARVAMPDDWFHRRLTGGTAIAGTKGAELDARLARAGTTEIVKTKSDSFSNPLLDERLAVEQVGELFIAGLDAGYCVKKTILGARNRGYKVSVVREAIATSHSTPIEEHIAAYEAAGAVMTSLEGARAALRAARRTPP
jgi:nicotinamidase-related amidase